MFSDEKEWIQIKLFDLDKKTFRKFPQGNQGSWKTSVMNQIKHSFVGH